MPDELGWPEVLKEGKVSDRALAVWRGAALGATCGAKSELLGEERRNKRVWEEAPNTQRLCAKRRRDDDEAITKTCSTPGVFVKDVQKVN